MMHKVMLIDDDVPMLKVLKQMIDWESLGLHIVAATYSSTNAIHIFKETLPDIVITDIGLPQKDGIELAEIFLKDKSDVRIIFLTCHEDFNYAQQAVKLKAADYLIKDALTAEQLEQSLRKTIFMLNSKAAGIDNEVSNYSNELLKQGLFKRIMDGVDPKLTIAYAAKLGVVWEYPWFMMGVVHLNYAAYEQRYSQSDLSLIMYGLYNISVETAASYQGITSFAEGEKLIVLYNYRLNLASNANLHFNNYLDKLQKQCSEFIKTKLNIVTVTDKLDLQSVALIYHRIAHNKSEFYGQNELTIIDVIQSMFLPAPQGFLDLYKANLERALLKGDTGSIQEIVTSIETAVQDKKIEPKELVRELSFLLRNLEISLSSRKQGEEFYYYISAARSIQDVMRLVKWKLIQIIQDKQQKEIAVIREPKLQIIQQYIDQHLSENITSIDMARYLYLNPSYFSRYFKRLTGKNFTDYVHQYKMEIASKMLRSSSQTLESLAMVLGYSDRTYFSKVFKKYIGMTPSEYKSN